MIQVSNKLLMASPIPPIIDTSPIGGQTFLANSSSPATFSWTVPTGVNYISAVAIGGGGKGGDTNRLSTQRAAGAGGGGALAYSNKIPVTPGEILTVVVGSGFTTPADSSISRGSTVLLRAVGGSNGNPNSGTNASLGGLGGQAANCIGQVCFSGGKGGDGTQFTVAGDTSPFRRGSSGGGAAGYAGNGGDGASLGNGNAAPTGGGGGGGATGAVNGGKGGGVGLYGLGASGAGGVYDSRVVGGPDGDIGSPLDGGTHNTMRSGNNPSIDYDTGAGGGGNGARYTSGSNQFSDWGSSGAVRIIHGPNETFPVNCTTNSISFIASTVSSDTTILMPSSILPGDLFILYDWADYSTNTYTGSLSGPPTGWTSLNSGSNSSTFTLLNVSILQATSSNATSLQGSTVTGHGGVSIKSKVILQFRGQKALAVYRSIGSSVPNTVEQAAAPGTSSLTPNTAFPYSNGMSIVTAFFRGSNPIVAGTDISHTGATYIAGATGTNTIVSYKIYGQSATTYSSTFTMADMGLNTLQANHLLAY